MRLIEIGVGADGKSFIAAERTIDSPEMEPGTVKGEVLWSTTQLPPQVEAARRAVDENWLNVGLAPSAGRWMIAHFAPGHVSPMHHTSTLDYDVIIAGEVTLDTEHGSVALYPGDCVMVPGCMHRWNVGEAGCTMATVLLGLAPAPSADRQRP
jgi:mannose-6-phosphate isomerase-like protein (cupin superfamily)